MPEVRPIDANAAADKIMRDVETHADEIGIGAVAIMIAFARALRDETDFPTIEPEVRHGRWCRGEQLGLKGKSIIYCSSCKREAYYSEYGAERFNFCPYCGADMREEGADNGNG